MGMNHKSISLFS